MIAVTLMICVVGTVYDVKYYQPMIKLCKSANMSYINRNETAEIIVNGDTTGLCFRILDVLGFEVIKYFFSDSKTMTDESTIKNYKPIEFGLGCRVIRCFSMYSNNKIICNTNISSGSQEIVHGLR